MIIGIGGVSMAGKSTLARRLKEKFPDKKTIIFCQDDFVLAQNEIPKVTDKVDWERPESVDLETYASTILNFNETHDIVFAEGLFAFYDERLRAIYDKKIYIHITKELFLDRKSNDLRWGPEPEWYVQHIWDSFLEYGNIDGQYQDIYLINGAQDIDLDNLLAYLKK